MWIETSARLAVKVEGQLLHLTPGQLVMVPDEAAMRLLRKAPETVQVSDPASPCPRCRHPRFWCPTCNAASGAWVCGCTHPRQAQDMTRSPEVPETLIVGQVVMWESPLFGRLSGVYLGPVGLLQIRVAHPFGHEAVIPVGWCFPEGMRE